MQITVPPLLQPQLDSTASPPSGRATPNQNLSSEYTDNEYTNIFIPASAQSLICVRTVSRCSGDVKRENRFVRAPPRLTTQPIRRPGDRLQRPAIINPEDLKDLDELDNDCEDGWAGEFSFWVLTSDHLCRETNEDRPELNLHFNVSYEFWCLLALATTVPVALNGF